MAFAIDMPNIDPATDTVVNPQDWRDYIISVRELENRLNSNGNNGSGTPFNFLSNLSQRLQDIIETRRSTAIRAWVDGFRPTAPLIAAQELPGQLWGISTDASIRHNRLVKNDTSSTNIEVKHFNFSKINTSEFSIPGSTLFQLGFSENSVSQNRFINSRLEENSFGKICSFQVDFLKKGLPEISSSEVSEAHITVNNFCITENCTSKINISEDTTTQILSRESALTHIGSREIGFFNNNLTPPNFSVTELQSRQVESTKVSLPSIISIQQLNSSHLSHDNTSFLSSIYSTAQTLWDKTNPINFTFKITNLPTGQLAEATITGYDNIGRPNSATISIDI
jgi:hypothetical protein